MNARHRMRGADRCGWCRFFRAAVAGICAEAAIAWVLYLTSPGRNEWMLAVPVVMSAAAVVARVGLRGAYGVRRG